MMIMYKNLKRSSIYKRHTNPGDIGVYVLMLNVDRNGATYMEFTRGHSNLHKNIDSIYFKDIDCYASIFRIRYIPWFNSPPKNYEFYRKVSDREMRKVTTVMKELFDGDIVYDNNRLCYKDEINEETTFVRNNNGEESEPNQSNTDAIIYTASNIDKEVPEQTISTEESIVEPVLDNTIGNEIESDSNDIDNTIVSEVDNNIPGACDNSNDNTTSEKYIDLLKNVPTTDAEFIDRRSKRNRANSGKKGIKKEYRRYFSETEALSIAHMRNIAISEKYCVDSFTSYIMKKNALEYFGMKADTRPSSKKTNYFELFDAGYTLEQVMEMYPNNKSNAMKQSYNRWRSKNSESAIDYEKRFNKIVESDNMNELIELSDMKIYEIMDYLQCPSQYANMISVKIRRILSKKSIFFPVFGSIVFDSERFNAFIDYAKQGNSKANIVTTLNYDTCIRLQDTYNSTFDRHQDIIIGADSIPKNISSTDVCKFISIIKRTFAKKIKSDHIPDIDIIIKNNDRMEYATRSMIEYNKACSSKIFDRK